MRPNSKIKERSVLVYEDSTTFFALIFGHHLLLNYESVLLSLLPIDVATLRLNQKDY